MADTTGHDRVPLDARHSASVNMLSCRDDLGAAVAWWFLYKFPRDASPERHGFSGAAYALITPTTSELHLSESSVLLNSSALGRSLSPIYQENVSFLLYNDQPPGMTWYSSTAGHSKGVLMTDADGGGFFLQHSIPRFPARPEEGYKYGDSQLKYGQHALCVNLDASGIDAVAYA